MSTIGKALDLLDLFSEERPTLGLSEAARLLRRDKASVLRHLTALESKGFVEQDAATRSYRLGPALTRLSLVREMTNASNRAAGNILSELVRATGETAHLSHFHAGALRTIAIEETPFRGTRVYIDPTEALPLHATGSGVAYLSQCDPARRHELLQRDLPRYTEATEIERRRVGALVDAAAKRGVSVMERSFESDVVGVAAAVFDASGEACGAVAVATPTSRFDGDAETLIAGKVADAATAISRHYGALRPTQAAE